MKRSVPDLHTDFIYSVGAEEFGLVLSLVMIGLYAFIVFRGMGRAMKLNDPFEQTAAAGLFMLIGLQCALWSYVKRTEDRPVKAHFRRPGEQKTLPAAV